MWQSFYIQHMCENTMAQAVCVNGEVKAKGLLYTVRSVWKIVLGYNKWLNTLSYESSWVVIWLNYELKDYEWAKVTRQTLFACRAAAAVDSQANPSGQEHPVLH